MNILELAILKKMVGGGGGSGTDNYNDLSNLPQINGETLAGNKTAENLGLQDALTFDSAPTEDSTNPVESGGVYNALAGKQDNLTFDDDPTENSTNPVKSGGVYSALAGKQDNLTFDGVYNASTNKAATESTVTNAIAGLDVSDFSVDADETISSISETDGKINVTKQDIAIASNQVTAMTGYTKPSSAPATPAIQTSDTANQAFGKLEFKADTNQTNILSVQGAAKELADKGAKNLLPKLKSYTDSGLSMVINDDNSITAKWSATGGSTLYTRINDNNWTLPRGTYVLSGMPSDSNIGCYIHIETNTSQLVVEQERKTPVEFSIANDYEYLKIYISVRPNSAAETSGVTISPMIVTKAISDIGADSYVPPALPNYDLTQGLAELNAHPFLTVPFNHNMIYRGKNLGDTLTDAQHTALSSGNFTDLYLGDYWTKSVTIPAFYEVTTAEPADWSTNYTSYYTKSGDTYTAVSGSSAPTWAANTYYERQVPEQTVTLKAVIADFDTFYAGYASTYAGINTHHAAVIVHGFNNVVWNKTNSTAGGYVNSLIHKWLVNSVLPQIETWFGSANVLSHQKLLTNAITGDAASGWAWSSQKISLLSENQMYGSKVWGGSKATNGGYEPGEALKHLNVFNHIDANLLFGNGKNIWLRDIASAGGAADLHNHGLANNSDASFSWLAPAALILLS